MNRPMGQEAAHRPGDLPETAPRRRWPRRAALPLAAAAGLLLALLLAWLPGRMVLRQSLALERQALNKDVNRVVSGLQNEIQGLDNLAADWSAWDNAYRFVLDRNAGFIKENLGWEGLLSATRVNLVAFLDVRGRLVWGGFRTSLAEPERPLPPLLSGAAPAPGHDGFLLTPAGPLMVVTDPILRSSGSGRPAGTLVMGRLLDAKALARLAQREGLPLQVEQVTFPPGGPAPGTLLQRLAGGGYVAEYRRDRALVRTLLPDLAARGGLLVTIPWPRDLYHQGRRAAQAIALLTFAVLVLLEAGLLLWFFWFVRSRARVQDQLRLLVEQRTAELREANRALQEASMVDLLTGLKNRRFVDLTLPEEVARTLRVFRARQQPPVEPSGIGEELVFMVVDIDHFKRVNDTFGHAAGDAILHQVGDRLQRSCRSTDLVARWGGEEFLVAARRTHHAYAPIIAEKLVEGFREAPFRLPDGTPLAITCSVGYCPFPVMAGRPQACTWLQAVDLADQCLYRVKREGRNGWAGLEVPPGADLDRLLRDLPEGLPALVAAGELAVRRSAAAGIPVDPA